ncbi:MAG: sugar O-acetyltransferase [Actinomycetota bacterium]|nr:sugar O-acetyltransferase [Actinomycetota bacterium]
MMTEKEKMLSGQLYLSTDEELTRERNYAKRLCFKFNKTDPTRHDRKMAILKKLFRTDNNCYIEPPFYCDYGYNIIVGKGFYANHGCVILDVNTVKIGDDALLGPGVQICTPLHPIDHCERNSGLEYGLPIEIGNNVWIGAGAVILPDLKIGNNSIIGAGSIVTGDIPSNVLAVGNPCKVIKEIT